jgi:hypothetical protein
MRLAQLLPMIKRKQAQVMSIIRKQIKLWKPKSDRIFTWQSNRCMVDEGWRSLEREEIDRERSDFLSKREKRKIEERRRRLCYEIRDSGLLIVALYQWNIKYLYFLKHISIILLVIKTWNFQLNLEF